MRINDKINIALDKSLTMRTPYPLKTEMLSTRSLKLRVNAATTIIIDKPIY